MAAACRRITNEKTPSFYVNDEKGDVISISPRAESGDIIGPSSWTAQKVDLHVEAMTSVLPMKPVWKSRRTTPEAARRAEAAKRAGRCL